MEHKFNVNFSESAYEALDDLARRLDVPKGDIIRDALCLYRWLADEQAFDGGCESGRPNRLGGRRGAR